MCIRDRRYAGRGRRPAHLGRLGDDQRLHDPAVHPAELPGRDVPRDQAGTDRPGQDAVSYTHLRAHETVLDLVCRLLLEKKKKMRKKKKHYHLH